jgi:hypothetical protein
VFSQRSKGNTVETLISTTLHSTDILNSNVDNGIYYPESDGLPMANSAKHFEWVATTKQLQG